jgi:hypothetical protein
MSSDASLERIRFIEKRKSSMDLGGRFRFGLVETSIGLHQVSSV